MLPKWKRALLSVCEGGGEVGEEVVVEDEADAHQLVGVDGAFAEKLAHLTAVARQAAGKLCLRDALPFHHRFYFIAYMNHYAIGCQPQFPIGRRIEKRSVGICSCRLSYSQALASPSGG